MRMINCDHRLVFECFLWLSAFHSPERTLQEYEKQTGIMLAIHSLTEQLNCDSGRISCRGFHERPFSASADLVIGLICQEALIGCSMPLDP
jgi:hypothetical protein